MIPSVLPTYSRFDIAFDRGEGVWLWDVDGRRYLDLGAGIATNALGHAHPLLVETVAAQAARLWHVSNLYRIPEQEALADRLTEESFAETVFFTNSGTEACELAVKMARKHFFEAGAPDRTEIVTVSGSFHGRSSAAIAAAASEKLTRGFGPLLPGFVSVPFGDHEALRAAVTDRTAAVLVEPIQGEGGIRVLPDPCLKGLRDLADEAGALLILDEVQCGMGRTGKLFAHDWAGIAPDIVMAAKGLGAGFPLGAVLATAHAASGMTAGTHGSTLGGSPLACAVGLAVLDRVAQPTFLAEIARRGARFAQGLAGLVAVHPRVFSEFRGAGLMLGLRAVPPVGDVVRAGQAEGLLTVPAGDNVLRILPPLNITEAEIDEALVRLDRVATAIAAHAA